MYKCSECDYKSIEKRNIEKHFFTKKCKDKNPKILLIEEDINVFCIGCNKKYLTKPGLKYHVDRCEKIKEMKKPINILMMAQKQNGNEQLLEIIKNQQIQIDELIIAQKQTQREVNVIKNYLSNWHSPYIYDNFHQLFLEALESGRTNMSLTFPTFIKLIYNHPENYTICHKNKKKSMVMCHENSKWISCNSNIVYQKVKNVFFSIYFPLLKAELPYENKNIIKSKKLQLEYEEDNRSDTKYIKNTMDIIEADFQSVNKLCNTKEIGEIKNDALIFQNSEYIFKIKTNKFKEAFEDTKKKINGVEEKEEIEEEEIEITDNDEESDCDYELPEDNIDSYYDSTGELIGTVKEKNNFINWRRSLINERRNDISFVKSE